jgi:hypothetical protein
MVGINPAHFQQAKGATYFPLLNDCNDLFWSFYWQNSNNVSREEIARAIAEAESEITTVLGYSPAPWWTEDEIRDYPRPFRRDVIQFGMGDSRGYNKSVQLTQGRFIQGGRRATTAVQLAAAVVYTDDDGDGYDETATITAATSLTEKCEIKCYLAGEGANPDWEFRSPQSVTLSGGNVIFKYWAWQLIDPELQQKFPISTAVTVSGPYGVSSIDIEASASYVSTVDIYREYNDFTAASAQFFWERTRLLSLGILPLGFCCNQCDGAGCPACDFVTQDGCIHARDAAGTNVVPVPATYDSDSESWQNDALSVCRDPDLVKVWYYAGDYSQEYLSGRSCDPLSHTWAEAIMWLAVARVNRPFCTCNNSLTMLNELQRDLSFTGSRVAGSYTISPSDLDNPFGTKMGEVKAWKRIGRMAERITMGMAV